MKIKTLAIVSLSSGVLGESFLAHERRLGLSRLEKLGVTVRFMPHALDGLDFLKNHPEARAQDLLQAFRDPSIDGILCAIGGDDTYRLLPALFEENQLARALSPKPFLGFSDTTVNHLMLHKLGLPTFYGQAFLPDVCELDREMLPYTRSFFEEWLQTGTVREVRPSPVWYESREENGGFGPERLGTATPSHPDSGFVLLQGPPAFSGEILGGCVDTLFDLFSPERYADQPALCQKYELFPRAQEWKGKILLLESSEEKMPPEKYRRAIRFLRKAGVFEAVSGVLVGKPMDRAFEKDYHQALLEELARPSLPVLANLNVGHALPHCILPLGVPARVDANAQKITFSAK